MEEEEGRRRRGVYDGETLVEEERVMGSGREGHI